jgi:hypothetical protein
VHSATAPTTITVLEICALMPNFDYATARR